MTVMNPTYFSGGSMSKEVLEDQKLINKNK